MITLFDRYVFVGSTRLKIGLRWFKVDQRPPFVVDVYHLPLRAVCQADNAALLGIKPLELLLYDYGQSSLYRGAVL